MLCIKTRIEWLKRIIAALTGTCIFGDAVTFINKDCRVLFGDGQQCAARGGEIWLQLTEMICPWAANLTVNSKMSNLSWVSLITLRLL